MATKGSKSIYKGIRNPSQQPSLDHWYGHLQHVRDGVASDPVHEDIPKGPLSSKQYVKKEQKG